LSLRLLRVENRRDLIAQLRHDIVQLADFTLLFE
jgi:hypothetical protein